MIGVLLALAVLVAQAPNLNPLGGAGPLPIGPKNPVAQSETPGTQAISRKDWEQWPSDADIARAYPRRAYDLRMNGHVTMQCALKASGELTACSVISEDPKGLGFGEATIAMRSLFKLKAGVLTGDLSQRRLQIPVYYYAPRPRMLKEPLTYQEALSCIAWHSTKLRYAPGDQMALGRLPVAEALTFTRGREGAKPDAAIRADIEAAKMGEAPVGFDGDKCFYIH